MVRNRPEQHPQAPGFIVGPHREPNLHEDEAFSRSRSLERVQKTTTLFVSSIRTLVSQNTFFHFNVFLVFVNLLFLTYTF